MPKIITYVSPINPLWESSKEDNHSSQDDIHSSQDDIYSSQDDIHSTQDDIHSSQDDIHFSQEDIHSSEDDINAVVQNYKTLIALVSMYIPCANFLTSFSRNKKIKTYKINLITCHNIDDNDINL